MILGDTADYPRYPQHRWATESRLITGKDAEFSATDRDWSVYSFAA